MGSLIMELGYPWETVYDRADGRYDVIRIIRPLKLYSFSCSLITVILLAAVTYTANWEGSFQLGVIIGLIIDFIGTGLVGIGIRSINVDRKYKYYSVGIRTLLTALIILTLVAIICPVTLGLGYGVVWGCIILLLASVLMLFLNLDNVDIFYREHQD